MAQGLPVPSSLSRMSATAERPSRAEQRKLELRQEIIDAAFDCFAERGYHATGIADIAARLGIGHGTFYRYFDNKRDIVDQVITQLIARIAGALQDENAPEAVDSLDAYVDQAARIGESLGRILVGDPRVARMLLLEAPGIDPAMGERVLDFFEGAATWTAAYLDHGVKGGYLRADLDVAGTATAINGMIFASALAGIRNPDAAYQRGLSEAIRRLMYDGITGHEPRG
jgi:AcrR family transcriptional regulator